MKINTIVYRPASIDIIPYKITGIRQYSDHIIYEATAEGNVGACGRVKVLISENNDSVLRFVGLHEEDKDLEYSSGLLDFVEGIYYKDKLQARLKYNDNQLMLAKINLLEKERLYKQAKDRYNQVKNIVDNIKKDIKDLKCK